jgi:hypothetical protein
MSDVRVGLLMIGVGRSRKLEAISSAVGTFAIVDEGDFDDFGTLLSQSTVVLPSLHCKDGAITCKLKNEHKFLLCYLSAADGPVDP